MSKSKAAARVVGRTSVTPPGALFASSTQVYEALVPLACVRCRGRIPIGAQTSPHHG